jgi:hypothetical protein
LPAVAAGAWLLCCGTGLFLLWSFSSAPGQAAEAPLSWPAESGMSAPAEQPELVLFAHPRCPCTRATLEELDRLMLRCDGRCAARVVFFLPEGEPASWAETDLWEHAARIPGVTVLADPGGREAALFGAGTSGQVLLYAAGGALLYEGGITASRGHAGENAGSAAIQALVRGESQGFSKAPVFGCPMTTTCSPRS